PANSHPLALSTGQFVGTMVQAIFQSNLIEERMRTIINVSPAGEPAGDGPSDHCGKQDIFEHVKFRQQMIELKDKSECGIQEFIAALLEPAGAEQGFEIYTIGMC